MHELSKLRVQVTEYSSLCSNSAQNLSNVFVMAVFLSKEFLIYILYTERQIKVCSKQQQMEIKINGTYKKM